MDKAYSSALSNAKRSDEPKHALGLVQYLRSIGYEAWIEDVDGNEIEEAALKSSINRITALINSDNDCEMRVCVSG